MYYFIALCGGLLLSPILAPPFVDFDDDEPPTVRVMSFNVRFGTANDGDNAWPKRREILIDTIKSFDPDLLGTQETLPFQADYIRREMPHFEAIGWSRDASSDGEQCTIFYRRDRFRVIDSGQYWLSDSPNTKFSKSWDSSLPRVVTWVRLSDRSARGAEFLFLNTHFDHRGEMARKESALLIRSRLESMPNGLPIILTGDFNCDEASEPWIELARSSRIRDVYRAVHPTPTESDGTFHGFRGTAGTARIDWILCSREFEPTHATINRTNRNGRYPSDHFPVTAVLRR